MDMDHSRHKAKVMTTVASILVIVGIVVLIELLQSSAKTSVTTANSSHNTASSAVTNSSASSTSTTPASPSGPTSTTYKNGTYTADAQYYVPHGYEDIKVTLTISGGVVTDSSIVNSESNRDSQGYQQDFTSTYRPSVVGKSIADIKLSYVAGASDTTSGFNDAVAQIRTKAQS